MKRLIAIAAVSMFTLAACAGAAGASGGTVNATLSDSKITLDRTNIPSGNVTFVVKNTGTIPHELVVVKTDLADDKIPVDPQNPAQVSEEGSQGETGDLDAGQAKTITLQLAPGKYVLMCNQEGHYAMGMHVPFTVTK